MTSHAQEKWLSVGSARGCITLYDMRFHLPVNSILHPSGEWLCHGGTCINVYLLYFDILKIFDCYYHTSTSQSHSPFDADSAKHTVNHK